MSKPTAIVVGAGLSGIVSSLLLAMHGYSVTVVEQARKVDISLRGFFRKKFYFDSGLHFVGELSEGGLLRTYLRYLGVGDLPCFTFDQNHFETIRFSDGSSFSMPYGYQAMVEALVAAFPDEEKGIVDYMRSMKAAYDDSAFHTLKGPIDLGGETKAEWQVSLKAFMEGRIKNQKLRNILSISCLLHGVSPKEITFLQHARIAGTHFDTVSTFEQGGYSLVRALEKRMKEEGITVLRGHAVTKVLCSAERVLNGVALDNGESLAGSVVVYTGHPAKLADILPDEALRSSARSRIKQLRDTTSAYILYMTTQDCPDALNKRNVVVCSHNEPFEKVFEKGRKPSEGPFYVMPGPSVLTHSEDDTKHVMDIVALVPTDSSDYEPFFDSVPGARPAAYKVLKEQRMREFSDALFKACPDFNTLEIVDGATPLTLRDYLKNPMGGLYGASHSMAQFNPMPITRIPNLYIAGQAVVAPGIIGSLISAFLACGFVIGHDALLNEVNSCK